MLIIMLGSRSRWSILGVLASTLGVTGCPGDDGSAGGSSTSGTRTSDGPSSGADPSTGSSTTETTGDPGADDTSGTTEEDTGPVALPARLGVTADWLARTLSVIDLDALAQGARTREELVTHTIDLAPYAPGPLQVELTPDGTTAVVSVSPGFYGGLVGGFIGVDSLEQDGTLLRVDLQTAEVTEITTVHVPMGIAISPDGSRAYTANYGLDDPVGSTVSVVDLGAGQVLEEFEVGARPEQISLDPEGTRAILNVVGLGAVRVFETEDPAGTLSAPLEVGSDPSDVDFVPGTPYAIVANSLEPFTYALIDVSDPQDLVLVAEGPPPSGAYYGATPIPGTSDVMFTASDFSSVYLHRTRVGDGSFSPVVEVPHAVTSFPLGVAIDTADGLALMATPGANANTLLVQDLDGGTGVQIPWQEPLGPTYVAVAGGRAR